MKYKTRESLNEFFAITKQVQHIVVDTDPQTGTSGSMGHVSTQKMSVNVHI